MLEGADLFIGVSGARLFDGRALQAMNPDPIVFAMANPDPEVAPEEATQYARVVATGRSDYPNQINNVLCFPGIFRGALDVRATQITEAMKTDRRPGDRRDRHDPRSCARTTSSRRCSTGRSSARSPRGGRRGTRERACRRRRRDGFRLHRGVPGPPRPLSTATRRPQRTPWTGRRPAGVEYRNVLRPFRSAAREAAQVARAGTPTHGALRDKLVAIAIATLGIDLICAVLAYLFEHHTQQTDISTFGSALFWTTTQLLTVSSSIHNPASFGGRVLDVLMEAYAITVVATMAGAMGTFMIKRAREIEAEAAAGH